MGQRAIPDTEWTEEFARLEALQHEVQAEIGQFRAEGRIGRDEVHDRAVD
jgi:hypothetical protein